MLACPRGLLGCLHFFFLILFSIVCLAAVISTILSSRLPFQSFALFCHWFLLVYRSSSYACFLVLLGLWQTFLTSSPFFFWDPRSSLPSLFWILFLEGCPFPLHLDVFQILSCPFIWDLTFCFFILINFLCCGFCSSCCGIVVLLASFVCPLMEEAKRLV